MYIHHTKANNNTLGAIATLVVISLVLWSVGFPSLFNRAEAANLTTISDTLSNSRVNLGSNHTIVFTTPTGITTGQTLVLNFPSLFILGSTSAATGLDFNDMDCM